MLFVIDDHQGWPKTAKHNIHFWFHVSLLMFYFRMFIATKNTNLLYIFCFLLVLLILFTSRGVPFAAVHTTVLTSYYFTACFFWCCSLFFPLWLVPLLLICTFFYSMCARVWRKAHHQVSWLLGTNSLPTAFFNNVISNPRLMSNLQTRINQVKELLKKGPPVSIYLLYYHMGDLHVGYNP